jgi:multicomponent Na+:H+ antiporter subunit D
MLIAMGIAAALCIGIGVYPAPLYALLPYPVTYEPYTGSHVLAQLQLLMFSALAFSVLMRTGIYPPELRSVNLDFDWVWRRLLPVWGSNSQRAVGAMLQGVGRRVRRTADRVVSTLARHTREDAALSRTQATRNMALAVLLMLAAYLLLYLVR